MTTKLLLKSNLSPGDALVLTAAIHSLHTTYPDEYITDVRTAAMQIWENNPFITKLEDNDPELLPLLDTNGNNLHYDLVHQSNQRLNNFIHGYVNGLSKIIDRPLELQINRPLLYLTKQESEEWMDQVQQYFTQGRKVTYWLMNAGVKQDFTTKQWPIEYYQKVVDETSGFIQWVQVGESSHSHHPLRGVIDLIGKTNQREFIRLVYHSSGGIGPVTYLQHLCAAFEKPYFCLLGGRESQQWTLYPKQVTFHTIGQLKCCNYGGCWKSRVVPLNDRDESKNKSLCEYPLLGYMQPVGKCMAAIKPEEIILAIKRVLSLGYVK